MDDDWQANLARLLIAAWGLLVLTLFAIAVIRELPDRPASDTSQPDPPMMQTAPCEPFRCGEDTAEKGSTS